MDAPSPRPDYFFIFINDQIKTLQTRFLYSSLLQGSNNYVLCKAHCMLYIHTNTYKIAIQQGMVMRALQIAFNSSRVALVCMPINTIILIAFFTTGQFLTYNALNQFEE